MTIATAKVAGVDKLISLQCNDIEDIDFHNMHEKCQEKSIFFMIKLY